MLHLSPYSPLKLSETFFYLLLYSLIHLVYVIMQLVGVFFLLFCGKIADFLFESINVTLLNKDPLNDVIKLIFDKTQLFVVPPGGFDQVPHGVDARVWKLTLHRRHGGMQGDELVVVVLGGGEAAVDSVLMTR